MKISNQEKLTRHLRQELDGKVYSDSKTLQRYSTDKSIYRFTPQVVVLPSSIEDLQKTVQVAVDENIAITMRGGGSGTAGASLGHGIVVHYERGGFLNNISNLTTDGKQGYIDVGAGVYHDVLQSFLQEQGYYLPADPSSGPLCQIGGNIATKASGPHGFSHGSIDNFIEDIQYICPQTIYRNTGDEKSVSKSLLRDLQVLQKKIIEDTKAKNFLESRQNFKTASGYNLGAFIQHKPLKSLIPQLFAGSVGTLGLITGARLRVEKYLPEKSILLLYFDSLQDLGRATECARRFKVVAIEVMSKATIQVLKGRNTPGSDRLYPGHLLFIECEGKDRNELLEEISNQLQKENLQFSQPPLIAKNAEELREIWKIRKQILPILLRPGQGLQALSIVNDVGVPPQYLARFIDEVEHYFKSKGLETILFGHAGNGNLHLRPLINTQLPYLKNRIEEIAHDVYEIVFRYQGTITAEHGMGPLRAPYLQQEWGLPIYTYMKELKNIFDPENIFNPSTMFNTGPITQNIRSELNR